MAQIATLQEIETHWSICDLYDALDCLDMQAEADRRAFERSKRK